MFIVSTVLLPTGRMYIVLFYAQNDRSKTGTKKSALNTVYSSS